MGSHRRRSLDLDETLDVRDAADPRRHRAALRLRVPRRQLRDVQHPERRAGRRSVRRPRTPRKESSGRLRAPAQPPKASRSGSEFALCVPSSRSSVSTTRTRRSRRHPPFPRPGTPTRASWSWSSARCSAQLAVCRPPSTSCAAGDYVACELPGGEPVVVVRGNDDVVRGFFNVCRHHAAAVVTEPSRLRPSAPMPVSRLDLLARGRAERHA